MGTGRIEFFRLQELENRSRLSSDGAADPAG